MRNNSTSMILPVVIVKQLAAQIVHKAQSEARKELVQALILNMRAAKMKNSGSLKSKFIPSENLDYKVTHGKTYSELIDYVQEFGSLDRVTKIGTTLSLPADHPTIFNDRNVKYAAVMFLDSQEGYWVDLRNLYVYSNEQMMNVSLRDYQSLNLESKFGPSLKVDFHNINLG